MDKLRVDVWSDVACPWCWVGKRHLEAAIAEFPHPVEVVWRAFELDAGKASAHDPSKDLIVELAKKYGVSVARAQEMADHMVQVGVGTGLDFRFDKVAPVNTFAAHRLLHLAHAHGRQDELKERLFRAYMNEGKVVSDHETLVALASDVGLDADKVLAVLADDTYADEVRADEAEARKIGITGVPFFVIGGVVALGGAQPPEVLLQAMTQAWEQALHVEPAMDADGCGPQGCDVPLN